MNYESFVQKGRSCKRAVVARAVNRRLLRVGLTTLPFTTTAETCGRPNGEVLETCADRCQRAMAN